ncbi:MAG: amidohydrolase family protein [Deltaproteobacteria bacterium]
MGFPKDIGVIDLLLGIPSGPEAYSGAGARRAKERWRPLLRDADSIQGLEMPAGYMFKDLPRAGEQKDYVAWTVQEMDRFGIERAMIRIDDDDDLAKEAHRRFPDRFFHWYEADAHRGMDEVRKIVRLHEEFGIVAVGGLPAAHNPQLPINDARWYPIYAKCVELDIAFCCNVGVPGPRVPFACQKVELIDEVCWFFPELRFVMRHGGDPWTELATKLMLKWPNLYYMTSAFAPKHYPQEIIDFANTRGSDKILYAGYFPFGLTLDRIFDELERVPFRDHVWPKFLRENALRVFHLPDTKA